jgi:TRAP-type mannitol/chloroaromatic compound transport system permease small subunit
MGGHERPEGRAAVVAFSAISIMERSASKKLVKIAHSLAIVIFISPMCLYSVHVLIALTLGKYRAIDRSTDPKGELQLSFF